MNKVVVIGGGSGAYTVLSGLKSLPQIKLTAIVSIADSGGSSGQLRDEFGILPPGDIRQAILALADPPIDYLVLRQLFNFRFSNGRGLDGHSFGNLMFTALKEILGSEIKAIGALSRMLRLKGKVLPISLEKTHLCARLEDGTIIRGESNIDIRLIKPELKILDIFLDPSAKIYHRAKRAILKANWLILGPGDLYTSILPNLIVKGTNQALAKSKAKIIYICNLMTKYGETTGFRAQDFVNEIINYLGPAKKNLGYILINSDTKIPNEIASRYQKERSFPVKIDPQKKFPPKTKIIKTSLAAAGQLWRHDPEKLKKTMAKIIFHQR